MKINEKELILSEIKGKIHSIETFGSIDGPGVRLVVFFQGCVMRCKYCHNPDTWNLDFANNTSIKKMTASEILQVYEKNMEFYKKGGITVTGGEPLLQIDFLIELFSKAKKYFLPSGFVTGKNNGIHTTLDTSGIMFSSSQNEISKFDNLCEVTDLVMLDIKHIDDEKHLELTGHSNKNVLAFANYLSKKNIPTVIRYVLVPSINDDVESLEKLADFVYALQSVQKIEILAYHDMAKLKYEALKIKYPLESIKPATKEDVKRAEQIISNRIRLNLG
ncbi:MAG: pyruvate formate lyase-activating protein [Spirochaetaceae bacterium]|nr:pyruvate formate lyase-activating protein [Spirochaetaceae bacterium]